MADITMCKGKGCGLKPLCYRYTAKPDIYAQSYFLEPPFEKSGNDFKCEEFWSNVPGVKMVRGSVEEE